MAKWLFALLAVPVMLVLAWLAIGMQSVTTAEEALGLNEDRLDLLADPSSSEQRPGEFSWDNYARGLIQQLDKNGDLMLHAEEQTGLTGKAARADLNKDGVITLDELIATGHVMPNVVTPRSEVPNRPIAWEYKRVGYTDVSANELGKEGWELVGFHPLNGFAVYKRPLDADILPPPAEQPTIVR